LAADRRAHLVVEIREVPLIRRLDDAVERDEHACGDFPHAVADMARVENSSCRPTADLLKTMTQP
jgi:hypothetical protein